MFHHESGVRSTSRVPSRAYTGTSNVHNRVEQGDLQPGAEGIVPHQLGGVLAKHRATSSSLVLPQE